VLDLWTDLLGGLDLRIGGEPPEPDNVMVFHGVSQQLDYHTEDGTLVAPYAQEALLRFRDRTTR
jgi:hypothetical protein